MILAIYLLIGFILAGIVIKSGLMEEMIQEEKDLNRNATVLIYSVLYVVGWPLVIFIVILLWNKL